MSFPKYKKQFKIVLILILLFVFVGAAGITSYLVRYSGTNELVCRQCHPEHREMWIKSNGHPAEQTQCYECHSRAVKVIPKEWNIFRHARDQLVPPEYLADDELTSQRCLDCHPEVLNLGYKLIKKVINFNHRIHYGEGLNCVDCHRTAAHEYKTGGTNRPTVWECLNCHLREFEGPPKNQKCLNCHDVMLVPGKSWTVNPQYLPVRKQSSVSAKIKNE
ncbi:MAG: cytochrome c3 family protein [Candidatus Aminicenantaceae bacterium]